MYLVENKMPKKMTPKQYANWEWRMGQDVQEAYGFPRSKERHKK